MDDDLRARLTAVLTNTSSTAAFNAGWPVPLTQHREGLGGHTFDATCALCFGDVEALTNALMAVLTYSGPVVEVSAAQVEAE